MWMIMPLMIQMIWYALFGLGPEVTNRPLAGPEHALYLSVVKIDHEQGHHEASILMKVFADDLQNVIRAAYRDKCRLGDDKAFIQMNSSLIASYFQSRFTCSINGKAGNLKFDAGSLENQVIWLKFSLEVPDSWNNVKIQAPFFTEIFSSQSNIIHLQHQDQKRFARLTRTAPEAIFQF